MQSVKTTVELSAVTIFKCEVSGVPRYANPCCAMFLKDATNCCNTFGVTYGASSLGLALRGSTSQRRRTFSAAVYAFTAPWAGGVTDGVGSGLGADLGGVDLLGVAGTDDAVGREVEELADAEGVSDWVCVPLLPQAASVASDTAAAIAARIRFTGTNSPNSGVRVQRALDRGRDMSMTQSLRRTVFVGDFQQLMTASSTPEGDDDVTLGHDLYPDIFQGYRRRARRGIVTGSVSGG